jgi:hypothetical protein
MKKMIIAFSALALVFTSCKKDDETKAVTPTKENLTGTWMITSVRIGSGGQSVDIFSAFDACQKDDKYLLNADLSYAVEDAGTKCDPDGGYTGGTWALVNSTTIDLDGETSTIKSFDGKNLVVSQTSGSAEESVTYVKQ